MNLTYKREKKETKRKHERKVMYELKLHKKIDTKTKKTYGDMMWEKRKENKLLKQTKQGKKK